jgi:hypothetical protein
VIAETLLVLWLIACVYVPLVLWVTARAAPELRSVSAALSSHAEALRGFHAGIKLRALQEATR